MISRILVGTVTAGLVIAVAAPSFAQPADPPQTQTSAETAQASNKSKQMKKAQKWARKSKALDARICRSGNYPALKTSVGSGAYLMTQQRWQKFGGTAFAARPNKASRRDQNLVAWRMFKSSGWNNLGCPRADWMRAAYQRAKSTSLGEMLIPGTHDSGSSLIDTDPPCTPQVIAGISAVFAQAAQVNPCGAADEARAQEENLGDQLRGGVRYLDIRVGVPANQVIDSPRPPAPDPLSVPLVLHHNYVSQSLTKGLRQVLKYTAAHPAEQVILDFQHLDLTGNQAIDEYYYQALLDILMEFQAEDSGPTVCEAAWTRDIVGLPDGEVAMGVPVGDMWQSGRSLLVLMPETGMPQDDCYFSRELVIHSPWPNTDVPQASKDANDGYLAERTQRLDGDQCVDASGNDWCVLFVNQLQLTPSAVNYANCVFNKVGDNCSLHALARLVNDKVAGYMTDWTTSGEPTNIEIIDYYEDSDPSVADQMIRLNWQRTGQWPR